MYITARPASAPDPLTYGTTYGTLQEPLQVVLVVRRVAVGSPERSGARLKLHKFVGLPRRHEPRREAVVVEAVVVVHEKDGTSMRKRRSARTKQKMRKRPSAKMTSNGVASAAAKAKPEGTEWARDVGMAELFRTCCLRSDRGRVVQPIGIPHSPVGSSEADSSWRRALAFASACSSTG